MTTLNEYLAQYKISREGGSDSFPEQTKWYEELFNKSKFKNVMEIGFNVGHSANTFLTNGRFCNVTSFDLAEHSGTKIGKEYIDEKFPNRHNLIIGNSRKTVTEFAETNKLKFDFILIDGDHSRDGAIADILNCKMLAHPDTILVVDDVVQNKRCRRVSWCRGPYQAWSQMKKENVVTELGCCDAEHTNYTRRGASWKQGFVWGKYVFDK